MPNLSVYSTKLVGTVVSPGSIATLNFDISTDGDPSPPYTFKIFLSDDGILDEGDELVETQSSDGLGSFGTHHHTASFFVPSDTEVGVGHFFIVADPDNEIPESNEDNNTRELAVVVSKAVPDDNGLVDLSPDDLEVEASLEAGKQFHFKYLVANLSPDDAAASVEHDEGTYAFKSSLVISIDPIISADDRILHTDWHSGVGPGDLEGSSVIMTLPSDIETGDYYFAAIVDLQQQLSEDSESNNVSDTVAVSITNNIPQSIDAIDDEVEANSPDAVTGNVFDNDVFQLFSTPVVDRVNDSAANVGALVTLASGVEIVINADGTYELNAASVLAAMEQGETKTETVTYRAKGVNTDVDTAAITINLVRPDPDQGTDGDDDLPGTVWADTINGLLGKDTISGLGANDVLSGDEGNDKINGGSGRDKLAGGDDNDRITGGSGRDVIDGGAGDDTLRGSAGRDTFVFRAGDGDDVVVAFADGVDRINLRQHTSVNAVADLTISSVADGTLVQFGGDSVLLKSIDISNVGAGDFLI